MFNSKKILEIRTVKSWSLADVVYELARKKYRYTRQTVSNWEHGVTIPKATDIGCLAEVFGVDVQFFFERD